MQVGLRKSAKQKTLWDFFWVLFAFSLLIRLAVGLGYYNPQDTLWYQKWALDLPNGLFDVYARADQISLDYPPLYLFCLSLVGWVFRLLGGEWSSYTVMFFMKFWPIVGDMLMGLSLFLFFRKTSPKTALVAALLWLFNPSVLFNSSFWGQTDQIMCLLLLLSFTALEGKRPLLASVLFAVAGMTKFQCLFFTPVFLLELLSEYKIRTFFKGIGAAALTVATVFLPFMIGSGNPFLFFDVYLKGQGQYPHCTLNAFNLYGLLGLNWVEDSTAVVGGISFGMLSTALVVLLLLVVIAVYRFAPRRCPWVIGFWLMNSLFLFMTRMHERYQFVVLIFLLMASLKHRHRGFFFSFAALSLMTFFNQLVPMFSWNVPNTFFTTYYGGWMMFGSLWNVILWVVTTYICAKFLFFAPLKTAPSLSE